MHKPFHVRMLVSATLAIALMTGAVAKGAELKNQPSLSSDVAPAQKTVLDNGLTIITKEIHTSPVVYFSVWYNVGARNEYTGATGISHMLEHMMFKGTSTFPVAGETDKLVRRIGGIGNAGTSNDYTVYYETVPAGMESVALRIEADRMHNALLRDEDLQSERNVVMEERIMRNEDSPTGLYWEELDATAFKVHPYGWPVIGWMDDIKAYSQDSIRDYYKSHYAPNNAFIVVCGDFRTSEILKTIRDAFGPIKPSDLKPARKIAEPPQMVTRSVEYHTDKTNLAYVNYLYHVPTYGDPDSPALELLAYILSSGRQSRMFREFVESGIASNADAIDATNADPYLFYFDIEVLPGIALTEIESRLDKLIENIKSETVSESELQRAKNRFRADTIFGAQSTSSYGRQLGWFEIATGDHDFLDKYLADIDRVTTADIQRVARKYLVPANLTRGRLIPETPESGGAGDGAPSSPEWLLQQSREYNYSGKPASSKSSAKIAIPEKFPQLKFAEKATRTVLDNGLTLLVYPNTAFPTVKVYGLVKGAGSYADPDARSGLAKLTAMSLRRGSRKFTYDQINEALEFTGAEIGFSAGNEQLVLDGSFLTKDFTNGMDMLADMLINPTFPEEGVVIDRGVASADAFEATRDPRSMAWQAFVESYYGKHPYSHPVFGIRDEIDKLTPADLAQFHAATYSPDRTIIAVVGDIDPAAAVETVRKYFAGWQQNPSGKLEVPPVTVPKNGVAVNAKIMPEKSQNVFFMGGPAPRPEAPDYVAFDIMSDILAGSDLTSRLYTAIREKEGLVYYVYGYDLPKSTASTFQIVAGVSPANIARTVELARREMAAIASTPVSDTELEDAKRFAIGKQLISLETNGQIAKTLVDIEYQGMALSFIDSLPARIAALTTSDIQAAAARYFDPHNVTIGVAGPEAVIAK